MIKSCRDTYYNDLRCKYGALTDLMSDSVAYRHRNMKCMLFKSKLLTTYLRIICEYRPFEEEVTSAWSFTFDNYNEVSTEVELEIDGSSIVYTGSGTGNDIALYYYQYFKDGVSIGTGAIWYSALDGSTLYLFTYDTSISYSVIINTSSTTPDDVTIDYTSLEDSTDTILELWNCITEDQLCSIIEHAYKLVDFKQLTSNCGCN